MIDEQKALRVSDNAIEDWIDAVELWVEDQDEDAQDFLTETTRYLFDELPAISLIVTLDTRERES